MPQMKPSLWMFLLIMWMMFFFISMFKLYYLNYKFKLKNKYFFNKIILFNKIKW